MKEVTFLIFLLATIFAIRAIAKTKIKERPPVDPFEKFILARIIFAEAAGEPYEGKVAVGCVVRNRVKSKRWPNTYREVILQPEQFSGVGSELWNKFINEHRLNFEEKRAKKECLEIAEKIISGEQPDITHGANHYYNPKLASPSWAKKMKITRIIGNHIFLKE